MNRHTRADSQKQTERCQTDGQTDRRISQQNQSGIAAGTEQIIPSASDGLGRRGGDNDVTQPLQAVRTINILRAICFGKRIQQTQRLDSKFGDDRTILLLVRARRSTELESCIAAPWTGVVVLQARLSVWM